ncbi:hypothetical protein B0H10DRAFT_1943152 [Mycena sp. CBHHK59/15]|nr:hypothetical protein B0H10DRAFT_1943152 [Mycena sp. CBHHK59/15]
MKSGNLKEREHTECFRGHNTGALGGPEARPRKKAASKIYEIRQFHPAHPPEQSRGPGLRTAIIIFLAVVDAGALNLGGAHTPQCEPNTNGVRPRRRSGGVVSIFVFSLSVDGGLNLAAYRFLVGVHLLKAGGIVRGKQEEPRDQPFVIGKLCRDEHDAFLNQRDAEQISLEPAPEVLGRSPQGCRWWS